MDEMIGKSTAIVRGRVTRSTTAFQGATIYTHYQVQVLERWKGSAQGSEDVVLPGGTARGYRQNFAGVPQLIDGKEYLLFLWTGKSGGTQVMGLTQGLFDLGVDGTGCSMASRAASSELMLDSQGRPVQDRSVRMPLLEMSAKIKDTIAAKGSN